jgi:hypothetical protein
MDAGSRWSWFSRASCHEGQTRCIPWLRLQTYPPFFYMSTDLYTKGATCPLRYMIWASITRNMLITMRRDRHLRWKHAEDSKSDKTRIYYAGGWDWGVWIMLQTVRWDENVSDIMTQMKHKSKRSYIHQLEPKFFLGIRESGSSNLLYLVKWD